MDRIGMPYAGEILTRGPIEGLDGQHDNAPHAVHVLLQHPTGEADYPDRW